MALFHRSPPPPEHTHSPRSLFPKTIDLKVLPLLQFLDDWKAKLWSRFFCLSVYVTMYLNDHQRSAFYESIGLNTTQFNRSDLHRL